MLKNWVKDQVELSLVEDEGGEAERKRCKIELRRSKSSDAWHEHEHKGVKGVSEGAEGGSEVASLSMMDMHTLSLAHTHTHAEEESSRAGTRKRLRNMRVRFFGVLFVELYT